VFYNVSLIRKLSVQVYELDDTAGASIAGELDVTTVMRWLEGRPGCDRAPCGTRAEGDVRNR
jgi:hypothetical protein